MNLEWRPHQCISPDIRDLLLHDTFNRLLVHRCHLLPHTHADCSTFPYVTPEGGKRSFTVIFPPSVFFSPPSPSRLTSLSHVICQPRPPFFSYRLLPTTHHPLPLLLIFLLFSHSLATGLAHCLLPLYLSPVCYSFRHPSRPRPPFLFRILFFLLIFHVLVFFLLLSFSSPLFLAL